MAQRGRPRNTVEDFEIKIHPPTAIKPYLEALVATGLYGKDKTAVANTLFMDHLKLLLAQNVIKRIDPQ